MPKKGKKGKKGGKKGKKGKKDERKKAKNAEVKSMANANSKLWQARVEIAENSKDQFVQRAHELVKENERLAVQMIQTEKDTIDVVQYLKKQDIDKDKKLEDLAQNIRDLKREHRKEKERIIDDLQGQINELEQKLASKTHEVEVMQAELKVVKEFRRKRGQMQKELEDIKEAMFLANKEHKDTLTRMEQRFFEEKMRLQQEANQKISELANRAHTEAIANLNDTTKSVYMENVRINEALSYHMEAEEVLKKGNEKLKEENAELQNEVQMNRLIIEEKVALQKKNKKELTDLNNKVETLEKALSHVVNEFDHEAGRLIDVAKLENQSAMTELDKVKRALELKTKECARIKRLAKNILQERTEIERFFLDALQQVQNEISSNRAEYRKHAQEAYNQRMLIAHAGKGEYPRIRTFNKSDTSTNSVFKDLEAAEALMQSEDRVDIGELTWEQKEKVLRYLFASINNSKNRPKPDLNEQDKDSINENQNEGRTFLTQAKVNESTSNIPQLPALTSC
ncbi:DgyrCDS9848 [Dimorphilus gyrociliatus]|uniref:Basal body-orientation factor 1 n=1 Tax=Dimorphilus gyrociliatus TaxID=2664684 RepID=A0A7I8W3I1_9ANNE|nr:DgyrCDS9848 [Dimorphilus gyrociliatus]